jgi:hypothetical protein
MTAKHRCAARPHVRDRCQSLQACPLAPERERRIVSIDGNVERAADHDVVERPRSGDLPKQHHHAGEQQNHYQQVKNMLVSYSPSALGFF